MQKIYIINQYTKLASKRNDEDSSGFCFVLFKIIYFIVFNVHFQNISNKCDPNEVIINIDKSLAFTEIRLSLLDTNRSCGLNYFVVN